MPSVLEWVGELRAKNTAIGCAAMQALLEESKRSESVYPFFDEFAAMLDDRNGYVRMRGQALIAANARWDAERKLDAVLPRFLAHVTDEKPIVARKCVQALPEILKARPDLRPVVCEALKAVDLSGYADSMRPLLAKDIGAVLEAFA